MDILGKAATLTLMLLHTRRRATLRRSLRLLASFKNEQTSPADFYLPLARDTADLVAALHRDAGLSSPSLLVDVGSGPGYFREAFRPTTYISVDPYEDATVHADGRNLPFATDSIDCTISSNAAEHVASWEEMGDEMVRVTKPGGLIILSYTIWLGPFGGHETGLWQHYLGGAFARDRYTKTHGHPPKNVFGESLFDVSCSDGIRWARSVRDASVLGLFPRYHPQWAWWVTRIPLLREFLTSNLVIVLQKLSS